VSGDWPARVALTLLTLAVFGVGAYGMARGWRRRAAAQAGLLPLPEPPAEDGPALLPPVRGLFVGTTRSGDWQAGVVAGGLSSRSSAVARVTGRGLTVERQGAPTLHVPAVALRGARVDAALAGKVMGAGGLLVVTWEHAGLVLDTAFRADEHARHVDLARAVEQLCPVPPRGAHR